MVRRVICILTVSLLVSSCAGAPMATEAPAAAEPPAATTEAPAQPLTEDTSALEPTQTFTPEPTLPPSITPTETLLPPLELPTEVPNAPAKMVWDGTPTYLGDSQPGYSFRVTYEPDLWALTMDQFGFPAIGHRAIPYCVITVTAGRGLPADMTVEHDVLYTDRITFDVNEVYESGALKFVTYIGGDGIIITGFEVSFQEDSEACLVDAVAVLSTLKSVPVSQATPQP